MPISIHNVVVHRSDKEQYQRIRPSQMRDTVLDHNNAHVRKLISSLVAVWGTRYNTAQYGVVSEGAGRGTFPDAFDRYAGKSMASDETFLALSRTAMGRLLHHATTVNIKGERYRLKGKCRASLLGQPKTRSSPKPKDETTN
jgi:nucleoid-associated protein YejK